MQTVTLSLFRFDDVRTRIWVLGQMATARLGLAALPGLSFFKLCGSGTGEGFTPRPNWSVWAIFAVWRDEDAARAGLDGPGPFRRWRTRACETATFHLTPTNVRGHWSGQRPFDTSTRDLAPGPLAVLTRATIKPTRALRFWNRAPDISARIGADPNVLFKIGIGEMPFLHQVTFSVWPDSASMADFARTGPHASAIRAVRDEGWFTEELYARFRLVGCEGRWTGAHRLAGLNDKDAA
ncbi:spheroidene monooxygenase [Pararhodobacter sp. SW119]|uniref:spheroidene monooxygenase n=1 Tax=Pararhodobacter sp. SW119 TaxID=2780075 RepID=UPI001ADEEB0E|nr:spheroidene monooxygenase [Pararhodobacter sp. SW119]